MACTYDKGETWNRLVLLLITQPREGWQLEFEAITRREIERLAPAQSTERQHDE
jgi:hypothetical protein